MRLSNSEIENRAIQAVIDFERNENRNAQDVRRRNLSYDVQSVNRKIEVKGIENSFQRAGNWRFIQQKCVQLLLRENDFYIYIVDNLINCIEQAGIYILNRESALKHLRVQPQITYTLQIPSSQRESYRVQ